MSDLLVRGLRLGNSPVEIVASGYLSGEALVDLRQSLGEDPDVVLYPCLLLLLLQNLLVELIPLGTQVLQTCARTCVCVCVRVSTYVRVNTYVSTCMCVCV